MRLVSPSLRSSALKPTSLRPRLMKMGLMKGLLRGGRQPRALAGEALWYLALGSVAGGALLLFLALAGFIACPPMVGWVAVVIGGCAAALWLALFLAGAWRYDD